MGLNYYGGEAPWNGFFGKTPSIKNKKLPGAFSLKETISYLYRGGLDAEGRKDESLEHEEVLSFIGKCPGITVDEENDVFAIGDDAIASAFMLNNRSEEDIDILSKQIIYDENNRVYTFASVNGFYDLELIPFAFPMDYWEGMNVAYSTHVVVIKEYRKHLYSVAPSCDTFSHQFNETKLNDLGFCYRKLRGKRKITKRD